MPTELKPVATNRSLDFGCLADIVAVIRREAFGTVEEQGDARLLEHGHTVDRGVQDRLEVIGILGQGFETEVLGDAGHAPRLGDRFEAAHEQLAGILLVIGAIVLHAQHRELRGQARDRFGHDVEMLGGVQRNR